MLNENIKNLRKNKGLTQEELAIRLNIVRQTISKWEKGLSVPDAEMLQKIADELETEVSALLGGEVKAQEDTDKIAEQLAKISEQLAIKNKRWHTFWNVLGISALVFLVIFFLATVSGIIVLQNIETVTTDTVINYAVSESLDM